LAFESDQGCDFPSGVMGRERAGNALRHDTSGKSRLLVRVVPSPFLPLFFSVSLLLSLLHGHTHHGIFSRGQGAVERVVNRVREMGREPGIL